MKAFKLAAPIALLAAILLTGCDDSTRVPSEQRQRVQVNTMQSGRVHVEKISEFRDELAYGDYRGVYIITDKDTGREFIGVSGIGISELGKHNCGKGCTARDER